MRRARDTASLPDNTAQELNAKDALDRTFLARVLGK
jgi:hypothetical protein